MRGARGNKTGRGAIVNAPLTGVKDYLRSFNAKQGPHCAMKFRLTLASIGFLVLAACATGPYLDATFSDWGTDAAVAKMLANDEDRRFRDVDITVFEGRLLLTGTVPDRRAQMDLVAAAWKVDDVKQVIDETHLGENTRLGQGFSDTRIDATIRTRLVANNQVRASNVKLSVSNGVVYLLGIARDRDALESLLHTARTSRGVTKVVSHIRYVDAPGQSL